MRAGRGLISPRYALGRSRLAVAAAQRARRHQAVPVAAALARARLAIAPTIRTSHTRRRTTTHARQLLGIKQVSNVVRPVVSQGHDLKQPVQCDENMPR